MALISKPITWNPNDQLTAADLNNDFDTIYGDYNGNITDANIASGAAIGWSKVSKSGSKTSDIANYNTLTTDVDGATVTFDLSASNKHQVTIAGNRTFALSNPSVGQAFMIKVIQDGTGSRTVTWFSGISWAGGTAPTLTTTASKGDSFGFLCTGSGTYDGFIIGQNI